MPEESNTSRRIGFVGLGRMGMAMCTRLAESGRPVTATDIRGQLADEAIAAGARWSPSAGAAADGADVVITMLPGPREVAAVIDEVCGALTAGATWIDMSTASSGAARSIAAAAGRRGCECSMPRSEVGPKRLAVAACSPSWAPKPPTCRPSADS
jgi:3-hydroxyisobutyrate dehydrogenase-like beta-hydroxyacid dehydrogenase